MSVESVMNKGLSDKQIETLNAYGPYTMAVWSVGEVNNGKMTGKSTTENPIEFIRPAEKEQNA